MPVPFANELRGTAGESQDDLLEVSVFALPNLKAIPEEPFDLRAGGPWVRQLFGGSRNLLHPGEHEDPAGFAIPVTPKQIPLTRNASQVPGLNRSLFICFGIELFVSEFDRFFIPDCFG